MTASGHVGSMVYNDARPALDVQITVINHVDARPMRARIVGWFSFDRRAFRWTAVRSSIGPVYDGASYTCDEGVWWILGWHDATSDKAKALLVAHALRNT